MTSSIRPRFELKYFIRRSEVSSMLQRVMPLLDADQYIQRADSKYPVTSLYFDTYDKLFFQDKMEGEVIRRKLRIRQYLSQFDIQESFFLEVKEKLGDHISKQRAPFLYHELVTLWKSGFDAATLKQFSSSQQGVMNTAKFLLHSLKLVPAITIYYDRSAFVGKYTPDVRITIDTNIRYSMTSQFPFHTTQSKIFYIDPSLAIIEIKSTSEFPAWIISYIQKFDLLLTSISKYCICLDDAQNQ